MSSKSISKGKRAERELARLLQERLGGSVSRNLQQTRDGGFDLTGPVLERVALEVKRCERLSISSWWKQTCRQADESGRLPVLAFKQSRKPWNFIVALGDFFDGFEVGERSLDMCATLRLDGFCGLFREAPGG